MRRRARFLVAERTVFRHVVPGIEFEILRELELARRIEFLFRDMCPCRRDETRKPFGPAYRSIFDLHTVRVGLHLDQQVELDVVLIQGLHHVLAQVVEGRGAERNPGDFSVHLRPGGE